MRGRRRVAPSLAVAQGEIARFWRTGSLLHLAHARRALEEAQNELESVRQRVLALTLGAQPPEPQR